MDIEALDRFSGRVPVFPLPNVVMMPNTFLPLHVFEPRYREMTADALAGERLIAMALLRPGWEGDYEGNPPIHDVVTVGRIAQEQKLADGRYNMLLFGLARARVVSIVSPLPYRTAEVELLEDEPAEDDTDARAALAAIYGDLAVKLGQEAQPFVEKVGRPDVSVGMLADLACAALGLDAAFKQQLLEDLNPVRRARKLVAAVRGLREARGRRFLPPSLN